MDQTDQTDKEVPDQPPDDPILVVGQPKSLRGELRLHNPGSEKIVLKEAHVRKAVTPSSALGMEATKAEIPVGTVALSAVIHPGESQRVSFTLALDRRTPPGEYHGELEVGGSTRSLVMHVAESVQLGVSPKQLVIDRRAGAKVIKRVILSNEGNVRLKVGEIGSLMLGEELLLTHGLRASIGSVTGNRRPLEKLFVEIIRDEAEAVTAEVGTLTVRNLSAPMVLEPGEVKAVDLEITVPPDLKTNSRYRARLPLYTADLEFVIVPVSDHPGAAAA